jgi:hypothetical protein
MSRIVMLPGIDEHTNNLTEKESVDSAYEYDVEQNDILRYEKGLVEFIYRYGVKKEKKELIFYSGTFIIFF